MYNEGYNKKDTSDYTHPSSYNDDGIDTVVGLDEADCKAKLYAKYGTNYKVLGKRPILKKGFLGFGQKSLYEMKVVINPKNSMSQTESFQKNRDEILSKVNGGAGITPVLQYADLTKRLEELQKQFGEKLSVIAQNTSSGEKHQSIQKIEDLLSENEFTFEYKNLISTRLHSDLTMDELDDFDFVQKTVVDWIGESIKIAPDIPHKFPHVIILVGPTGVGKTTTIAKLAGTMIKEAKDKNEARPSIKMITTDYTRIGAEEQVRHYGDIMGIDVFKADTSADVKKIYDEYKDSIDVLFIDTPGYSPNDHENIGKMRNVLELSGLHPDFYLTVSASAKAKDLISIIQNYEPFNYNSVIITKWDETSAIGNVVSVLSKKGKAISYITDGQQVPKRIEKANVIKFLTNLTDFKIDRQHIDEKFTEVK